MRLSSINLRIILSSQSFEILAPLAVLLVHLDLNHVLANAPLHQDRSRHGD